MIFIHVALKGTMTNPRSKKDHRKNSEKKLNLENLYLKKINSSKITNNSAIYLLKPF